MLQGVSYLVGQVAPAELETLLVTHPAVLDAAVIARPDDRLGEAPVAFVVLRKSFKPTQDTAKQLQQFVAGSTCFKPTEDTAKQLQQFVAGNTCFKPTQDMTKQLQQFVAGNTCFITFVGYYIYIALI